MEANLDTSCRAKSLEYILYCKYTCIPLYNYDSHSLSFSPSLSLSPSLPSLSLPPPYPSLSSSPLSPPPVLPPVLVPTNIEHEIPSTRPPLIEDTLPENRVYPSHEPPTPIYPPGSSDYHHDSINI